MSADEAEAALLSQFTAHRLFTAIEQLDEPASIEAAIRLVREILRGEYPDASGATSSPRPH